MSFDPNQPDDWSGMDGSGQPKRRDPLLNLFATNESRELEPIDEDEDDDVVPASSDVTEKTEPAETVASADERPGRRDRRPADRSGGRDRKASGSEERRPVPAKSAAQEPSSRPPAESAPAAKPAATSHWARLAGMLGIGGKTVAEPVEPTPTTSKAEPPPAVEKASRAPGHRSGARDVRREPKAIESSRQAEIDLDWKSSRAEPAPAETISADDSEQVEEIDPGHVRFLDGEDYVEFEIEELDPEGKLSLSKGAVSLDPPPTNRDSDDSPRGGSSQSPGRDRPPARRRRSRGPKPVESGFAEGLASEPGPAPRNEQDENWNDEPERDTGRRDGPASSPSRAEVARPDSESGDPDRPRKRRRRRGRGKGAESARTADGSEAVVADRTSVDEDRDEDGDGDGDERDVKQPEDRKREPRNARERNPQGRSRVREHDDNDDDSGNEKSRTPVTTWSTAISGMIDRNMASRKGRPSGGRGNSGKPRGNSGPRRR